MKRSSPEINEQQRMLVSPTDASMMADCGNVSASQCAREQSREIHEVIAGSVVQASADPNSDVQVQLDSSETEAARDSAFHIGAVLVAQSESHLESCRELLEQNRGIRAELDGTPHEDGAARESLIAQLTEGRHALLESVQESLSHMDTSNFREDLNAEQQTELDDMRAELEAQLESLIRWQLHVEIDYINGEIGAINDALAEPSLDPDLALLLEFNRSGFMGRRAEVAAQLTSDVLEYEQWDSRWTSRPYGEGDGCDPMGGGGCGPTSLAIILNYLAQADPEAERTEDGELILPPEVADMALAQGARVCGSGTNSERMIRGVPENFPGRVGREIDGMEDLDETLRSGQLVLGSLGGRTVGETSHGTDSRKYDGHVIVLRSVSEDGSRYRVLDCGANETRDIEWLTRDQVDDDFRRIWTVTMEY